MTQPPTPDAIRAAILAHRKAAMNLQGVLMANGRRGTSDAAVDDVNRAGEAMAQAERDLLAQIGAIPAAGMVTISRETARRAHSALVYLRVAKDEMQDDEEQRAERELASALAGGADDGVPDPNTPEGGNTPFDPREWVEEETGERFTDDEDVPTKAALRGAVQELVGSAHEYLESFWEGQEPIHHSRYEAAGKALDALIDRLPIANGEDT